MTRVVYMEVQFLTRSILILDNNRFARQAIKELFLTRAVTVMDVKEVEVCHDFFYILSITDDINTIFIAYDPKWSQTLYVIDKLMRFYPFMDIIIVVEDVHIPSLTLIRSFGVKKIISKKDSAEAYLNAIEKPPEYIYVSSKIKGAFSNILSMRRFSEYNSSFLTPAERYTISALIKGKDTLALANEKGCTIKTISQHKQNALSKLGCRKIYDLIMT